MNIADNDSVIPLTPQVLYVLLALAESQDNGYGLMRRVRQDSRGIVRLTAGTMYPLLKRIHRMGYITQLEPKVGSGPHGVKYVYRLANAGRLVLQWELDRYASAVELGRQR